TGGVNVVTTQYNWEGKPLVIVQKQEKAGAPVTINTIITKYSYDNLGRTDETKVTTIVSINGSNISKPEIVISKNKYDALGHPVTKELGRKKDGAGNYTTTPLEIETYDYNIRGWTLGL